MAAAFLSFLAKGSTGTQTITGAGLQGKVVFFLWTGQATAGVTDLAASGRGVAGYDPDGALRQSSHYGGIDDGSADPAGAFARYYDRCVIRPDHTSLALMDEASLTAFTADGFTLNWHTSSGVQFPIYALVLDPIDAVIARVTTIATGQTVVTGIDFSPDALIALPMNGSGSNVIDGPEAVAYAFGFGDGTTQRGAYAVLRQDGAGDAAVYGRQTDKLASIRNIQGALFPGAEQSTLTLDTIDADGFTVSNSGGQVSECDIVCLRGVQVAIGTVLSPAAPGTAAVALAFAPEAILTTCVPTESGQVNNEAALSVGFWANGQQGHAALGYDDNVSTVRAMATGTIARLFTPAATGADSTEILRAAIANPSATGFDVDWQVSGTANRPLQYLALAFDDAPSCSGGTVPSVADPADGPTFSGLGPHEDRIFLETDLTTSGTQRWALQTAMRDSPALAQHPGYKDGRITAIGSIIRRTTGRTGGWQASTCRWSTDDHDRLVRAFLRSEPAWYGREFRAYIADRDDVANAGMLGRFFVNQYPPTHPFGVDLEGLDVIGSEFSQLSQSRDILASAVFDRDTVPEAPADLLNQDPPQPIPVYMGLWSDEGSDAAPPTLIGASWRKAAFDVYWFMGFGNMLPVGGIDPPPAPTDITLTLLSGGSIQVSPLSSRLCVQVWAVTDGVEGDPVPFLGRDASVTITGDNRVQVDIDWAGADPDTWRIGVAYFYFLERWQQVIEIAGNLRTFIIDNTPILNGAGGPATGGTQIDVFFDRHTYKVVKVAADGRSAPSAPCLMNTGPYRRPAHVSFVDPNEASALRYELYGTTLDPQQFPKPADFVWRWTGAVDQIDSDGYHYILDHFDGTGRETLTEGMPVPQGMIPVWDTGDVVFQGALRGRLVMARWAWHQVISVFAGDVRLADNHADLLHADHSSWAHPTRYVTIGGVDCMVLYVRVGSEILTNHRDGTAVIRVNACTTEDVGDGTGSTISQAARAVQHLMTELVFNDHLTGGAWAGVPSFADGIPMIRTSDYAAAETMQIARVGGTGYTARIALTTPTTLGTFIEMVVQSFGLHHGIGKHGQLRAGHYDDAVDTTLGYPHYTDIRTIKGPIGITPRTDELENRIPYQWDFRPVDNSFAVTRQYVPSESTSAAKVANLGKWRPGPQRSLPYAADETTVLDVMQRALLIGQYVREWVEVPTDLSGLAVDVFDIIAVTDAEGIGQSGYVEEFILVLEHEVIPGDPSQQRPPVVVLKGLNITPLADAAWVWGPDSLTTWGAMTEDEQNTYGAWANEDDEIPDGGSPETLAPAKEWR